MRLTIPKLARKMRVISSLMLLAILSGSSWAGPEEASGVVIYVESGDTFRVRMDSIEPTIEGDVETVRLADVDSPDGDAKEASAAKNFTEKALLERHIWMDIDDRNEGGRGPYERLICVAYLEGPDGSINLTHPFNRILVDSGHATLEDFDSNEFDPDDWWPPSRPGQVVINEVETNPPEYDVDNEWVELYNRGEEDLDIGGWTLITSGGKSTVPPGAIISAKGFYVVTSEGYWLRNSDEVVVLNTEKGVEVDRTPALSDEKNDDLSWSRHPDGGNEWVYIISSRNSAVPSIIYSESKVTSTSNKNWLGCCSGGYLEDGRLWNVSEFFH